MSLKIVAKIKGQVMFQCEFKSCDFYSRPASRFAGFLLPWLKKVLDKANFPKTCPYPEGNYSWIGLNINDLNIPKFLPKGHYEITTFCYYKEKKFKNMLANLNLIVKMN
ncbi:uncharacterized protein [Musca autumnalis]|uniref:uncharacterized protein n=1 Tax=Musca autumnalis TaxID=221902 RepID=UPI003CEA7BEC